MEDLVDRILKAPARAKGAVGAASAPVPEAKIEQNLPQITRLFASDRLEDVLAALEAEESDWADSELATLRSKSPLSCKVSLRLLAEGAGRASFADRMIVATGLADRQISAMATHLNEKLVEAGFPKVKIEGATGTDWVLLDAGDIIVHLFKPEARSLYALEKMWGPELDEGAAQSA